MATNIPLPEDIIDLNVGGHSFTTTLSTIQQVPDTMLTAMFSGRFPLRICKDGSYFIDRDGTHFRWILNYLRDPLCLEPLQTKSILEELLIEAKYYLIAPLISLIEQKLAERSPQLFRVFYICDEGPQAQAVALAIESASVKVNLVHHKLVGKNTKLTCDSVFVAPEYLTIYVGVCLADFASRGGTVVVCGGLKQGLNHDKFSVPLYPVDSLFKIGSAKEEQKTLGKIHEPNHPILSAVEEFSFTARAGSAKQKVWGSGLAIAMWDYQTEPAIVIDSTNTKGLVIGLNFAVEELKLDDQNMLRLVRNALSLQTNHTWYRRE